MQPYTRKAIKSGIFSAIGFGVVIAGLSYYDDDFEIWELIFKTLFFGVFMSIYFNYSFKKESK